jgi:hypothetical protein
MKRVRLGVAIAALFALVLLRWVRPDDPTPAPDSPLPAQASARVTRWTAPGAPEPELTRSAVDLALAHAASALGATALRCELGFDLPVGSGPASVPHHRAGDALHVLVVSPSGAVPVFEGGHPSRPPLAVLRWGPDPATCSVEPAVLVDLTSTLVLPDGQPVPSDARVVVEGDCHAAAVEGGELRAQGVDGLSCQVVVRLPDLGLSGPAAWVPGQGLTDPLVLHDTGPPPLRSAAEVHAIIARERLRSAELPSQLDLAARADGLPAEVAAVLRALSDQADDRAAREIEAIEAAFDLPPTAVPPAE